MRGEPSLFWKNLAGDILWILGFLFSYFLFSTIISFVFFDQQNNQMLWGMGITLVILGVGELIKRGLK